MTFIRASASSGSLKCAPGLEMNVRDSQLSGALAFLGAACAVVGDTAVTASVVINVRVRFMGGPFAVRRDGLTRHSPGLTDAPCCQVAAFVWRRSSGMSGNR
ncbi:hypothetical protein ABZ929_22660 [Streptomyces physcomitrii]|uniref:hypothetical protein n=1 Tax=Streptomyces physcomitrii TaxID=2724184 RepID=UPI00343AA2CF